MNDKELAELINRYLAEDLDREEAEQLLDSLAGGQAQEQWETALAALLQNREAHGLSDPARMQAAFRSIMERKQVTAAATADGPNTFRSFLQHKPTKTVRWWRMAAAALLVGVLAGAAFLLINMNTKSSAVADNKPLHNVVPGGNKAVLILADGSQITLDSAGNGAIASQGNMQVIKLNSGQLAYNAGNDTKDAKVVSYNTLATPRGGQFQIILPDGTKVWLNAASSLRYPTTFAGEERKVQLVGEAYFEVAKMNGKPFSVDVNNMEIQVLGTHFNVMAYRDESSIRTTLLEGAVRINHGARLTNLRPGQQAQLRNSGEMQVLDNVDVEETVAWKNGYLQFNRESLAGVMRQVSRWYDADIAYEGQIPDRQFGGKISRNSSIDEVLKILELSNVHFRIEGKKITVTP